MNNTLEAFRTIYTENLQQADKIRQTCEKNGENPHKDVDDIIIECTRKLMLIAELESNQ